MNIEDFQTTLLEKRILQKFLEICFNASHLLKHMTDTGTFFPHAKNSAFLKSAGKKPSVKLQYLLASISFPKY